MRIAIVGSRHYPDLERVEAHVAGLPEGTTLVTGSASGVDAAAIRSARARNLPLVRLPASLEEGSDPKLAAERNRKLVEQADVLVAFWDGSSEGTRHTVDRALDAGKEIHVYVARPN